MQSAMVSKIENRKTYCWLFCAVLLILQFLSACSRPEVDVAISQQELQQKVAVKFPLEKNVMIANFSLHTPNVYLQDEKVGLKLKFSAQLLKFALEGDLDGRGTIRYDANTAQFYVTDFELISLEVADKSFSNQDQLQNIIMPALNNYLKETPVYTISDDTTKGKIAGKLLKRVTIKDDALVITFGP